MAVAEIEMYRKQRLIIISKVKRRSDHCGGALGQRRGEYYTKTLILTFSP